MNKRNSLLYLKDISDSIGKIIHYTDGLTFKQFSQRPIVIDAVVRNFEIIGEASKNVSLEIKLKYKNIPWREMAGMRDKIIHEYFGIDLNIVWATIENRLPQLQIILKRVYLEIKKK